MKFSHITKEDLAKDIAMFVMATLLNHPHTHEFMWELGDEKEIELDKAVIEVVLSRLDASED